jgi:3,4-dihydroxy 2-butanone 4-phosphate synthase/GTP cyclohydrolase II
MATPEEALAAAATHGWTVATVDDLAALDEPHGHVTTPPIELRLKSDELIATGYVSRPGEPPDLLLSHVDPMSLAGRGVALAVHEECLLGDLFQAGTCTCRQRLLDLTASVARRPDGLLLYLRAPRVAAPKPDVGRRAARILADLRITPASVIEYRSGQHAPLCTVAGHPT